MEDKWHFALPIFQNISVGVRETSLPGGDAQVCETRYWSCANIPWQLCKSCFVADLGAAGYLLGTFFSKWISCYLLLLFLELYPPNMFLGTHQKMHNSPLRTCFCSSSLLMPFPTVSCLGLGWSTRHDQELQDGRSGNVRNIISQCQEVVLVSECVDIL
jgi:hypothetical protein